MKHTARLLRSWLFSLFVIVGLVGLFAAAPANVFAQIPAAAESAGALLDAATGEPLATAETAQAAALSWQQALIPILVPLVVAGVRRVAPLIPKLWLPVIAAALGALGEVVTAFATGASSNVWLGLALGLAGVGVREAAKQLSAATLPPIVTQP